VLDPPVWHQPDQRHNDIAGDAGETVPEGEGDPQNIDGRRDLALQIIADGATDGAVLAVYGDQDPDQYGIGDRRHDQGSAISGRRNGGEIAFPHPARGEGDKRQPEQQVQIGPQGGTVYFVAGMEQVVVVVLVDADIDETERIEQEDMTDIEQGMKVSAFRCAQFQHHDGDDDGDDTIAESFETSLADSRQDGLHAVIAHFFCFPFF
jgi:hypothetical protein